ENKIVPVKVMAANPIDSDTLKKINTLLKAHFEDNLNLVIEINPALLSGFRIETPEKVFDASFAKQLRLIQHQLSPIST
ncbi:MAG: F0F1 ATP synthase subunit delta, partial [Alphaproteobacteria bacterium]|nr:F0F1 ATP synthase subunit delta [Alphaproteobacteria bacterium]